MEEYPCPVTRQCHLEILEQMNNSIGMIKGKNELCLFCYIKVKGKNIPVLLINNYINNEDYKDKIIVSMNKEDINIELEDMIYKDVYNNISIIKTKVNNNIKYIEIDDYLYEKEPELYYDKESIYIIQFNNIQDISVSYGIIKYINKNKLIYSGNININYNFSLIFNLSKNKLIGIHKNRTKYYNNGIFLNDIINEFIKEYK